jgi:hypothetical protein
MKIYCLIFLFYVLSPVTYHPVPHIECQYNDKDETYQSQEALLYEKFLGCLSFRHVYSVTFNHIY